MTDIPEDVMKAATAALLEALADLWKPDEGVATIARAILAERERLSDPDAVHVNMLRETIAKPSLAQIIHLYGEEALLNALSAVRVEQRSPWD